MKLINLFLPAVLIFSFGCKENHFREGVVVAGGKYVSKDVLNLGRTTYMEYCFACHGVNGDGNGVAAKGLIPPPRNFKSGLIKFGDVVAGGNPSDEQLKKIIREGLNGTAMLPWDISDERLEAVVQYIKTLAPETWIGKDKTLGEVIKANIRNPDPEKNTKDPFGLAHKNHAVAKGKEVYHVVAQCWTCHRAYESKASIVEMSQKYPDYKIAPSELDNTIYELKNQESEHGAKTLPPDFTWHEIRSANSVEEIFVRLAAGVAGTSMPSWLGTISNEEIWAVSYYVKHLTELKDKPERSSVVTQR